MRAFEDHDPIAIAVYFLTVSGIVMFCMDPIIVFLSLFGALMFWFVRNGAEGLGTHFGFFGLFLLMALINPLVSHNGMTVLFVINDTPITLEALIYGIVMSGAIIAVLYWFRSFTRIMTSDKLLYLFGRLSPKLALVLSMGLRYVPLFVRQSKKIKATQKTLGLYKDGNAIDRVKGGARVFSVMLTWALENGIVTADSMAARGYGVGKRSNYSVFRFKGSDACLVGIVLLLFILTAVGIGTGALGASFYPSFSMSGGGVLTYLSYISYGMMVLLPSAIEIQGRIRWKYLISRI